MNPGSSSYGRKLQELHPEAFQEEDKADIPVNPPQRHREEKPFHCPLCWIGFKSKASVRIHIDMR